MDWKFKLLIQKVVSMFPEKTGDKIYYSIQKNFGNILNEDPRKKFCVSQEIIEIINNSKHDINDKVFCEIGTGWRAIAPFTLWLSGAKKVITQDINNLLKIELVLQDVDNIVNNIEEYEQLLDDKKKINIFREKINKLREFRFDLNKINDLRKIGIEYQFKRDKNENILMNNCVDYVYTISVLEHVSREDIRDVLLDSIRILKPGGMFIHLVDASDHYSHADNKISRIHYLKYSDSLWFKLTRNRFLYQNRYLADDFKKILDTISNITYSIKLNLDSDYSQLISIKNKLSNSYKKKSEEIISSTTFYIVGEKIA